MGLFGAHGGCGCDNGPSERLTVSCELIAGRAYHGAHDHLWNTHFMTNKIALGLGLIIVLLGAIDVLYYGTENFVFLSKKLFELIEWLAFWR
ncbi:MAG: hypothetical protein ACI92Z_001669 [Paracoccaceae bacterium]|jgi:hypothetical protein